MTLVHYAAIAALIVVLIVQIAFDTAPLGYEDADGFHLGIGGGELRNLRNHVDGSDTVS